MAEDDEMQDLWQKVYAARMKDAVSAGRVHVSTVKLPPAGISVGDWIMYLPLEISEAADMLPQMARVEAIFWTPSDICQITTEQGMVQLRKQDTIEVVS